MKVIENDFLLRTIQRLPQAELKYCGKSLPVFVHPCIELIRFL